MLRCTNLVLWITAINALLDIAMRAQEDEDRLLTATFRLCQKADLVDADMPLETFKDKFLKIQVQWANPKKNPVDIIYRVLNTLSCKIYCIRSSLLSLTLGPSESVRSGRWFLAK